MDDEAYAVSGPRGGSPARSPGLFRPIQTSRTYEEAIEQIADAIRAGEMRVGDRLPAERTLAQQMGISRPTVREAIKALADVGVLQTRSGGGTLVRTDVIPRQLLTGRTELKITEVAGVLEARRLLEPRVAQLAALRLDDDDVSRLEEIIALQHRESGEPEKFALHELRFHLAIAQATKNSTVVDLMRSLLERLEIARELGIRSVDGMDPAIGIHERTLKSICGGDPDDIDAAMDEHLGYLESIWEEVTGRARLRQIPDFLLPYSERSRQTR